MFGARVPKKVDDEGILDRSLKIGVIPWDRILGANAQSIGGAMFVSLRVRYAEDFLGTLGPVQRQLAIANKAPGIEPGARTPMRSTGAVERGDERTRGGCVGGERNDSTSSARDTLLDALRDAVRLRLPMIVDV